MSDPVSWAVGALGVIVLTGVMPWVGIRMLAPSLAASPHAARKNYRGHVVFVGLGAAWVFWVAGMVVLRWAGQIPGARLGLFTAIGAVTPLAITALLFGLLDDAFGSSTDRGFAGHLSALGTGRLTTGAFKLIGIGLVSVAAASSIVGGLPGADADSSGSVFAADTVPRLGWMLVLGAVIALSANLVNLADLRPGRALKVYGLFAAAVAIAAVVSGATSPGNAALLALALAGPVVAIWRLDLGERGMLGDAGANAAGAVLGFVAAWECGRSWSALVVLVILLALNLASERWSFSRLVEGNRVLRYLDGIGRSARGAEGEADPAKSSPQSETPDG